MATRAELVVVTAGRYASRRRMDGERILDEFTAISEVHDQVRQRGGIPGWLEVAADHAAAVAIAGCKDVACWRCELIVSHCGCNNCLPVIGSACGSR